MVEQGRAEEGGGGKSAMGSSSANQSPLPMREAPSNYHPYPPPLAKYEDVVACPKLFMATLEKLHAAMGTKFMIPIIGGKDLDLHRLFVEVTSRGGIEKIIRERRWKEVTAIFSFPSTATNASFVLRKYYLSLLHHYEQIYFFKAKGWTPLSADVLQSPSTASVPVHGLAEPVLQSPEIQTGSIQHHKRNTAEFLPGDTPAPSTGSPVIGVIDGKFESGYLVTVTIGSEKFKGVLYQSPQNSACQVPQHSSVPQYPSVFANNSDNTPAASSVLRRRRRKKSEMKKRDPAHPKPNRSGYNFFFAEQHARLKPLYPGMDREISRMIGELWTKMKESEKAVYQDRAVKDKERYRIEMEEYRERLRTGQIISDAIPIQQRPPETDVNMMEADVKVETEGGNCPPTPENEMSTGKSYTGEDKTADKDFDMETSPSADFGAENVGMETLAAEEAFDSTAEIGAENVDMKKLADEEAFELRKRLDRVGDKAEEKLDNVVVETKKESVPCEKNESVVRTERESLPSQEREFLPGHMKESVPVEEH